MERGFFKVWRKIEDSRSYSRSALHRALMLTLMVRASWKTSWYRGREICPGQLAITVRTLAEELNEPRNTVHRALCDLVEDGMIRIENVGQQYSLITLVNWDSYQGTRENAGTRTGHERDTDGTQVGRFKELKKEEVLTPPFNPPSEQFELVPSGWVKPIPETVAQIPLLDGSFYAVTRDRVDLWKKAYPAIDVETEIRQIVVWCDANPKNRKTRNGVLRFLVGWLKKAQDKAPRKAQQPRFVPRASTVAQQQYLDRDMMARMVLQDRRKEDAQTGRYAQAVDEPQPSLPPGWL